MAKICKNCGKEVKDEFDFCVYCGEELPKHYICPDCKEEYLESDYEYCGKCGGKLVLFDSFNELLYNLDLTNMSREEICTTFWKIFAVEAEKADKKFSYLCGEPHEHWNSFSMEGIDPWAACHLSSRFYFSKNLHHVEVKIYSGNKPLYHHLKKREKYYNKQFPKDLKWVERTYAINIALKIDNLSIKNTSDWAEIIHQFISQMNKFYEVFSDDIKEFMD